MSGLFDLMYLMIPEAFTKLKTTDFEAVIKVLRDASKIVSLYKKTDKKLSSLLKDDATGIKKVLVETIAKHHPTMPSDISSTQFEACWKFLNHFFKVYTLNYDLLLYWTGMHFLDNNTIKRKLEFDDGFLHPSGYDESDYVTWGDGEPYDQKIFYLHGALHLFESESELKKFTWIRTGIRLTTQINIALNKEMYPLVVAEGTSTQKRGRIMRSEYLGKGFRSFQTQKGTLFVYGLAFSDNDSHILDAIMKSKIKKMWISLYGSPTKPNNKKLIEKSKSFTRNVNSRIPLEVNFFDAESAKIWG